jgi:hypothetical protein
MLLSPLHHLLSNHRPLYSHAAAAGQLDSGTWHQQQLIQLAALLTPPTHRARICKRLRSPGIDTEESISPAYVAWRASTTNRVSYRPARMRIDTWSP